MWSARYIRVDGNRLRKEVSQMSHARYIGSITHEDELIVLSIEVVEVILPYVFDVSRVDEAMAVWGGFNKHHWRQVLLNVKSTMLINPGDWHHSRRYTSWQEFPPAQFPYRRPMASSKSPLSSCSQFLSTDRRSASNKLDSRGGSCYDRIRCRTTAAIRRLPGSFPTCSPIYQKINPSCR